MVKYEYVCYICNKNIELKDIPRRENGEIKTDAFGNIWCQECADKHDNIDFEELNEEGE